MRMLVIIGVLSAIAVSFIPPSATGQTAEKPASLITVSGEGSASIVPDLAILTGGVTTAGKTAREASEANGGAMTAVMAAVKAAGIDDKDVQTSRLSLQPVRDQGRNEPGRITGFQASNQVAVKIRDLGKISDVIDRMVGAGANDISGIHFSVSSPSKPLDQARAAAIADARRKAEIYARAANVALGSPVSISEEGSAPPRPFPMRSMEAAAVSTPVSPGEAQLHVSVTVSYELLR
jgi:uncharacterized protein